MPERAASAGGTHASRLVGRGDERVVLDRFVEALRVGASGALVVHGEAGVGKTALLEYLVGQASGCLVVSVAGVQSEMELAFAALHQVCAPLLHRLDAVPPRQREALEITFGIGAGPVPDRFLVGLGVLSLLAEVAAERPLVCVVDDEQWLDRASAQVLAFVARRLGEESVGLVFGARAPSDELAGLPELAIEGLPDDDARVLLGSALSGSLDARVRDRIVAEARGNPLALLELPRALTAAELAGGYGLPGEVAVPRNIEEGFRPRAHRLPSEARRLVLLAAAEPLGDPGLVWRAAERLGIGAEAAQPATEAGLVEFGVRVRFRHPLVRSAAYKSASIQERQEVHRALAEVTDPETDPDRRAWHLAQAAPGPDEAVAAELERSAARAHARGGLAVAAAFLKRATTLTADPGRRAKRALAAAQALHNAGTPDDAIAMLGLAEAGPHDPLQRAHVDLLRAQVSLTVTRGGDAARLLLNAAKPLASVNPGLARATYLDALMAAMFAGHLASRDCLTEAARAALAAPRPLHDPRPPDLLLDGLAVRFTEGYGAAVPLLRLALVAFDQRDLPPAELRWLWLAQVTAGNLWMEQATLDAVHHLDIARSSGALAMLPLALATNLGAHVLRGDLSAADVSLEEMKTLAAVTGIPRAPYGELLLAAWHGREPEVLALIQATNTEALRRGEGFGFVIAGFAEAMLCNSLCRYRDALETAERAQGYPVVMAVEAWGVLVELIEGAARSGQPERAEAAFADLVAATRAAGTDWALGVEARSRALLSDGANAEAAYKDAIDRLGRTKIRGELARAHVLYGEWLRRARRRAEARSQLHAAHDMFTHMGMDAFAARAARELRATGETVRKRSADTRTDLTAQEAQVARLAREGLSNPEIGLRLFISARTVQYHLSKVFTKLGITSRSQLDRVLP